VIALGLAGFATHNYQSTHSVHSPAEPHSIAGQSTGSAPPLLNDPEPRARRDVSG
jgi:hypothetical protein